MPLRGSIMVVEQRRDVRSGATHRGMMGENRENRSHRAMEPDLPPAPQVPEEELSPPPEAPQEDLSSAPEVPEEDLSPPPEVQGEDLSPPLEAPEAQTSKERTSDERTENLEEPQGSERERQPATSKAMMRNLMVATAIAILGLLLLRLRRRSSTRR